MIDDLVVGIHEEEKNVFYAITLLGSHTIRVKPSDYVPLPIHIKSGIIYININSRYYCEDERILAASKSGRFK